VDGRTPIIPPEVSSVFLKRALSLWINWVDFVRAGIASYLLGYYWIANRPGDAAEIPIEYYASAVVGIGLLFQTFRFLGAGSFTIINPVFFASGAIFAVAEFAVALIAVIFGWTFAIVARRGLVLAPVLGVTLILASFITSGINPPAIVVAGVILFGPFCSVMLGKRSVITCRSPHYRASRPRR